MRTNHESDCLWKVVALSLSVGMLSLMSSVGQAQEAFLPRAVNSSTIPANGDVNPYGVAFVPEGFPGGGDLSAGDVLVSNFNNSNNSQGTGTTIIRYPAHGPIAPPLDAITFFASPLAGLSTALGVLRRGFVIVGNVPTTDGTIATISAGALQVLDRHGKVKQTWTDPVLLDGPWDLAIDDHDTWALIFVSNVLNGTVVRLDVTVSSSGVMLQKKTKIAMGYMHVPNSAALVLGPTGLAFDPGTDTLFVASTADNAIYSVFDAARRTNAAGKGELVFSSSHLRGPLALRFAPNGNLLTANGDAVNADALHPSEIVEFTRWGEFVREYNVDASQGGAFGLDTRSGAFGELNLALIDDVTNNLFVIHRPH
jgi:DNA-binding beta-propeller fold protein YncE